MDQAVANLPIGRFPDGRVSVAEFLRCCVVVFGGFDSVGAVCVNESFFIVGVHRMVLDSRLR